MPPIVLDDDEGVEEGSEFEVGAAVRLVALQGAAHLNGQTARVLRFVPEKRRYEVSMCKGGDVKSLKPANLSSLPLIDEVALWRDEIASPEVHPSEIKPAISRLMALPVSIDVLQKTRIGRVVNEMVKRLAKHEDIADHGKALVKHWRDMYQKQKAVVEPAAAEVAAAKPKQGVEVRPDDAGGKVAAGDTTKSAAPYGEAPSAEEFRPIMGPNDALRLVTAMRDATFERTRMSILSALDRTSRPYMPHFLSAGGLAVLDRWIRVNSECRHACLSVLRKIPVTCHDLKEVRVSGALLTVLKSDARPENQKLAQVLLDKWRSEGTLAPGEAQDAVAAVLGNGFVTSGVAEEVAPPEAKRAKVAPAEPPDCSLPPGVPEQLSKMLDPRIVEVIKKNPQICEFLSKHRSVYQNLNAENLRFLIRNLQTSREVTNVDNPDEDELIARTVTISNLHPQATEMDVMELLDGAGLGSEDVSLPRESRRQRSCGVAYVVLSSRDAVRRSVRDLQGALVRGRGVRVEMADGVFASPSRRRGQDEPELEQGDAKRRLLWQQDENLWDVAFFDGSESVAEFQERLKSTDPNQNIQVGKVVAGASARFRDQARSEHEDEKKRMQEALAGHS